MSHSDRRRVGRLELATNVTPGTGPPRGACALPVRFAVTVTGVGRLFCGFPLGGHAWPRAFSRTRCTMKMKMDKFRMVYSFLRSSPRFDSLLWTLPAVGHPGTHD